jgi:hypothetical protein
VSHLVLGITDLFAAIILSVWLFDERFTDSPGKIAIAVVAFMVVAAGVIVLSRTAPQDLTPDPPGHEVAPPAHPARWGLAGGLLRVQHQGVLLNVDCYQELHRLTGRIAGSLAFSLVFLAVGIFFPLPFLERVLYLAFGGVIALRAVAVVAGRMMAFRADQAGITLGSDLFNLPFRFSPVFISWADIERIVLYRRLRGQLRGVERIGIERRPEAPALRHGNEPAPGCPVPGVAAGATRLITTWQLDRQRLAAATTVVAPGIRIADFSTGP